MCESLGLVALADGMGGYQAGEVASEMAVKIIIKQLYASIKSLLHAKRRTSYRYHSATVLLEQAVLKANQAIYEMGEQQARYQGMGTTVVAVLFHNHLMSVAHVGDSRLYRLRGNDFRQITKDHSVRQELIDCGLYTPEQARNSPNKNLVTRALGVGEQVDVEVQELEQAAQLLIDAANAKGGRDNISLVLVRPLSVAAKPRKGWLRRLFGRN